MKRDGTKHSLWQDTTGDFETKRSASTLSFDVIIAGAGITGITTGLLLQKAGKKVMIAEAHSIGFGTTGGITAHLNNFMDTPYYVMQKNFGEDNARLVAQSVKEALSLIKGNISSLDIECEYKELPGYLFSQDEKQTEELEKIRVSAAECGIESSYTQKIPLPIPFEKALEIPGQACFHPARYLNALAVEFERAGGIILEKCRIIKVEEGETCTVHSSVGQYKSSQFIYATHIPPGVNLLHFRCAPYRSYALAMKTNQAMNGLVYDMYDPYHYYRTQEIDGEIFFIAGGEDHKTGHEVNTENCFRKLEAHIKKYLPIDKIVNQWSSQYFEPTDGLPYIGRLPGHADSMFVATGFGGNGMIYSAVAAITLKDLILENKSPYEELYDPNRIKLVAGFSNFVKEAADVTGKLLGKIIPAEKLENLAELAPGEAVIAKYEGNKLAIYKNEDGQIYALSPACTHIKCDVAWNTAEKTWDCPCHGSRFSYTGEMLTGPARKDLELLFPQK